jgi:chaperone required for assembly of F1-ATPase
MNDNPRRGGAPRNPIRADVTPLPRRFYASVSVAAAPEGFAVHLDGRPARTPAKTLLLLPTERLAEAVAAEWAAQQEKIDVATMPLTRLSNTAIDGVAERIDEVRTHIVNYAGSDLLCYRAEHPEGLVDSQRQAWDPVLGWVHQTFGVELKTANGIMPIAQADEDLVQLDRALADEPVFALTAIHIMTTLTGSALLALAVRHGRLDASSAWAVAHVDEDWQIAQWGEDAEAKARRALRWQEMAAAAEVLNGLDASQ